MSVVGPRSDRPITIREFEARIPGYNQRLKVKSGITGMAQVMGKYNTDPEDKLRFDMIYIKNYSLLLDIKIILMTLAALLPRNSTVRSSLLRTIMWPVGINKAKHLIKPAMEMRPGHRRLPDCTWFIYAQCELTGR